MVIVHVARCLNLSNESDGLSYLIPLKISYFSFVRFFRFTGLGFDHSCLTEVIKINIYIRDIIFDFVLPLHEC